MASTVIQMITPVIRELGEDVTDASTQQLFVDWTVDALAELYNETGDWNFLHGSHSFSTSPGSASYTLGTLIAEVKSVVRESTNIRLPPITERELARRGFDISQTGAPRNYIVSGWDSSNGPTIRLWPVPNSSETITVYRTTDPAALTATDTLEVPNAFFGTLRNHVRSSYWAATGDTQVSDRFRQQYSIGVRNLRRRFSYSRDNNLALEVRDIPRDAGAFRDAQLPGDFQRT